MKMTNINHLINHELNKKELQFWQKELKLAIGQTTIDEIELKIMSLENEIAWYMEYRMAGN